MEEFQPWYEQIEALNHSKSNNNRILQVLLYLIEKEFNFTDEGTYFAQGVNEAKSMNECFSESLCNEILASNSQKFEYTYKNGYEEKWGCNKE